jgi:uncharacterized protein
MRIAKISCRCAARTLSDERASCSDRRFRLAYSHCARRFRTMERASARRLCLLMLAAVCTACSCARHAPPDPAAEVGPGEIEVKVVSVGIDDTTQARFVMLSSVDQEHQLPILVGDREADAIARALQGVQLERPFTHDLMKAIIQANGERVDCVSISDLRDEVYYATIYMNGGKTKIDSRPSDAIALAANFGAPIFVASKLFENEAPRTATAMGITVEELTPPLAQYFHASRGVLIADLDASAARNGIERGDIITQVGMHAVGSPAEFAREASTEAGGTVVLRVSHDGAEHNVSFAR